MNQRSKSANVSSEYMSMTNDGFQMLSDPADKPTMMSQIFLHEILPSGKMNLHDIDWNDTDYWIPW